MTTGGPPLTPPPMAAWTARAPPGMPGPLAGTAGGTATRCRTGTRLRARVLAAAGRPTACRHRRRRATARDLDSRAFCRLSPRPGQLIPSLSLPPSLPHFCRVDLMPSDPSSSDCRRLPQSTRVGSEPRFRWLCCVDVCTYVMLDLRELIICPNLVGRNLILFSFIPLFPTFRGSSGGGGAGWARAPVG